MSQPVVDGGLLLVDDYRGHRAACDSLSATCNRLQLREVIVRRSGGVTVDWEREQIRSDTNAVPGASTE